MPLIGKRPFPPLYGPISTDGGGIYVVFVLSVCFTKNLNIGQNF